MLGNILGRNSGKRVCGLSFVYCMMVAQRYVSSNGTVGLKSYFHFVKKQKGGSASERVWKRKNGLTDGTLSWVSQKLGLPYELWSQLGKGLAPVSSKVSEEEEMMDEEGDEGLEGGSYDVTSIISVN